MIQKIYIPRNTHLRQVVNFLTYVEFTKVDPIDVWTAIFPNAPSNQGISLSEFLQHQAKDSDFYNSNLKDLSSLEA